VRAFERAWEAADEAGRMRATAPLKAAVSRFFGLALGEAARGIDDAAHALRSAEAADLPDRWAASLNVEPGARLLDSTATELSARLTAFYRVCDEPPSGARVELELRAQDDPARVLGRLETAVSSLPLALRVPLERPATGDHRLCLTLRRDAATLATAEVAVSIVERLEPRLEASRMTVAAWPETPRTTPRESVRLLLEQLSRLEQGATLELDVPAARRLEELEQLVAADRDGTPFLALDRPGDYWLALATPDGGRSVPARLLVPPDAGDGTPRPLIVALHGAGGSENLFFESYGAGRIVGLCRERGWLLLAPRSPLGSAPVAGLVEALAAQLPVDRERVVLIGHSMGASQATATASADPARYAALVALGGGGRVTPSAGLPALPVFVGIGTEDFALRGARALAEALRNANVKDLALREYPGIEHLAIVQVALPEVFAWLDERLARAAAP
jgi:pimeloyl-ACP methyl ester carboxylesterase